MNNDSKQHPLQESTIVPEHRMGRAPYDPMEAIEGQGVVYSKLADQAQPGWVIAFAWLAFLPTIGTYVVGVLACLRGDLEWYLGAVFGSLSLVVVVPLSMLLFKATTRWALSRRQIHRPDTDA